MQCDIDPSALEPSIPEYINSTNSNALESFAYRDRAAIENIAKMKLVQGALMQCQSREGWGMR